MAKKATITVRREGGGYHTATLKSDTQLVIAAGKMSARAAVAKLERTTLLTSRNQRFVDKALGRGKKKHQRTLSNVRVSEQNGQES